MTDIDPSAGAPASGDAPLIIQAETPEDWPQVRRLHALAFVDTGQVSSLVEALRAAPAPLAPTSLVGVIDGQVVGHVMLSAGRLDAPRRIVDVLVLSPLGVLPAFQRRGVGSALVRHALATAKGQGAPLVFLEGSPRYYGPREFERASAAGFRAPSLRIPDPAFQVVRLSAYKSWMTGTLVYAEPFWALDCVGLREEAEG